jgi:hypothetical protein
MPNYLATLKGNPNNMNALQRIRHLTLSLLCLFTLTDIQAEEIPDMSCMFDVFILVNHRIPNEAKRTSIRQSMRIKNGKTDEATLKLDGADRATNSHGWKAIPIKGWQTWESTFVGDFAETLTLAHDLGANKMPLQGKYKASIVSTGIEYTSISIGTCSAT